MSENTRFAKEFWAGHNSENAQKPTSREVAGGCKTRYVCPLVLMLLIVDACPCLDRV